MRKNITKELKFNRCVIFQPILTKETVPWMLGLIKEENKHKKEADQNSMYLVLLTVVKKVDHSTLGEVVISHSFQT